MRRIAPAALIAWVMGMVFFAAPAAARVIGSVRYEPFQAPAPAGDRGVAWLDDGRQRDSSTLWTARYGGKPHRVQRFFGGPLVDPGDFAASATRVALRIIHPGPGPPRERPLYEDVRTFAGPFGGPLRPVAECRFSGEYPAFRLKAGPFQLRGHGLVFGRGEGCRDRVERDLNVGAGSDHPAASAGVFLVQVAGDFVAWLEADLAVAAGPATAVVVDRRTGQAVTRVPLDRPQRLSLRDDGTLALSSGGTVSIAEPGALTARQLAIHVSQPDGPLPWVGRHLAVTSASRPRTLQLIDTNGTIVRRLVQTLPDVTTSTATGINDTHVAWLSRGCRGVLINARPLSTPGTVRYRRDRYRCRLRRAGPTTLTARRVHLGISCKSQTLDCLANITVRLGRRVIATGTADRSYRHGTAARGVLRTRPRARRLLRTLDSARLRITARYDNTDSIRRSTVRVRRR